MDQRPHGHIPECPTGSDPKGHVEFPDYSQPFKVFCDASKYQVRLIIGQKTKIGLNQLPFLLQK
jgi:hypothetical protein